MDNPEFLEHFWRLGSLRSVDRQDGVTGIIKTLAAEKSNVRKKTEPKDEGNSATSVKRREKQPWRVPGLRLSSTATSNLPVNFVEVFEYTAHRLLHGVVEPSQEASRQGCAAALTTLLKTYPKCFSLSDIYDALVRLTSSKGTLQNSEKVSRRLGFLFGLGVLLECGYFHSKSCVIKLEECVETLLKICLSSSRMQELAALFLARVIVSSEAVAPSMALKTVQEPLSALFTDATVQRCQKWAENRLQHNRVVSSAPSSKGKKHQSNKISDQSTFCAPLGLLHLYILLHSSYKFVLQPQKSVTGREWVCVSSSPFSQEAMLHIAGTVAGHPTSVTAAHPFAPAPWTGMAFLALEAFPDNNVLDRFESLLKLAESEFFTAKDSLDMTGEAPGLPSPQKVHCGFQVMVQILAVLKAVVLNKCKVRRKEQHEEKVAFQVAFRKKDNELILNGLIRALFKIPVNFWRLVTLTGLDNRPAHGLSILKNAAVATLSLYSQLFHGFPAKFAESRMKHIAEGTVSQRSHGDALDSVDLVRCKTFGQLIHLCRTVGTCSEAATEEFSPLLENVDQSNLISAPLPIQRTVLIQLFDALGAARAYKAMDRVLMQKLTTVIYRREGTSAMADSDSKKPDFCSVKPIPRHLPAGVDGQDALLWFLDASSYEKENLGSVGDAFKLILCNALLSIQPKAEGDFLPPIVTLAIKSPTAVKQSTVMAIPSSKAVAANFIQNLLRRIRHFGAAAFQSFHSFAGKEIAPTQLCGMLTEFVQNVLKPIFEVIQLCEVSHSKSKLNEKSGNNPFLQEIRDCLASMTPLQSEDSCTGWEKNFAGKIVATDDAGRFLSVDVALETEHTASTVWSVLRGFTLGISATLEALCAVLQHCTKRRDEEYLKKTLQNNINGIFAVQALCPLLLSGLLYQLSKRSAINSSFKETMSDDDSSPEDETMVTGPLIESAEEPDSADAELVHTLDLMVQLWNENLKTILIESMNFLDKAEIETKKDARKKHVKSGSGRAVDTPEITNGNGDEQNPFSQACLASVEAVVDLAGQILTAHYVDSPPRGLRAIAYSTGKTLVDQSLTKIWDLFATENAKPEILERLTRFVLGDTSEIVDDENEEDGGGNAEVGDISDGSANETDGDSDASVPLAPQKRASRAQKKLSKSSTKGGSRQQRSNKLDSGSESEDGSDLESGSDNASFEEKTELIPASDTLSFLLEDEKREDGSAVPNPFVMKALMATRAAQKRRAIQHDLFQKRFIGFRLFQKLLLGRLHSVKQVFEHDSKEEIIQSAFDELLFLLAQIVILVNGSRRLGSRLTAKSQPSKAVGTRVANKMTLEKQLLKQIDELTHASAHRLVQITKNARIPKSFSSDSTTSLLKTLRDLGEELMRAFDTSGSGNKVSADFVLRFEEAAAYIVLAIGYLEICLRPVTAEFKLADAAGALSVAAPSQKRSTVATLGNEVSNDIESAFDTDKAKVETKAEEIIQSSGWVIIDLATIATYIWARRSRPQFTGRFFRTLSSSAGEIAVLLQFAPFAFAATESRKIFVCRELIDVDAEIVGHAARRVSDNKQSSSVVTGLQHRMENQKKGSFDAEFAKLGQWKLSLAKKPAIVASLNDAISSASGSALQRAVASSAQIGVLLCVNGIAACKADRMRFTAATQDEKSTAKKIVKENNHNFFEVVPLFLVRNKRQKITLMKHLMASKSRYASVRFAAT